MESRPDRQSRLAYRASLSLRAVSVSRAGRRVLAGVTFDLSPGEAIILKGANGSGKTTLLRAIAGFLPAENGAIEVQSGESTRSSASDRRACIAYCGHADAVKAPMTVRENLSFWARLYGAPERRIAEALASFALQALADTHAGALSAGQRRRLGLARLVIAAKPIWLLDEPTSSMDAASSARLVALIENHRREGGAVLIATHDRIEIEGARNFVLEALETA
ncbi:MAG: heme ABC exporter ATP-binding protein CcmA [Alphaproteobacteria bacterium]|nr:heme ABC exporter ATP-binding protein CcmA [Alphaproteobacteria bacterium]